MTRIWGIVPAAGMGSRIQPLAFSKELLPVGTRMDAGRERPRAVGAYLVERMMNAGASRICFVVDPGKADITEYFGRRLGQTAMCGSFRLPGRTLMALHHLWCDRNSRDEYFGTLVNAYLAMGGAVRGIKKGKMYVDVGTLHGYREAIRVLCDSNASLADAA